MTTGAITFESELGRPLLRRFLMYFLRLGTVGFGGPIALAGYMHRDLVEDRKWISNQDFLEGLSFSQLSPGPPRCTTCYVSRLASRWHTWRHVDRSRVHYALLPDGHDVGSSI